MENTTTARYIGPPIESDVTLAAYCGTPAWELLVCVDWENRTINITTRQRSDNSTPAREFHGHQWSHHLPTLGRADALKLIEALKSLVDRVTDLYSSGWDGSNYVAVWADYGAAEDLLHEMENLIDNVRGYVGRLWDANDWLEPGDFIVVSATATDADLERLAEELQSDTHGEGVHLHGLEGYLLELRTEAREAAREE